MPVERPAGNISAAIPMPDTPVPVLARIGFGAGAFGVALIYAAIGVLQLYFYTRVIGLSPGEAGTVLFLAAMCDALVDPVVGWLASRTNTRWGRYRPYLLFGAIPLSLAFLACFWFPPLGPTASFWYALFSFLIFRAAFQLIYMPYTSMIVVISRDADERSDIEAWRAWFTAAGLLAVSFGALSLIGVLGQGDDHVGFARLAAIIGAVAAAAFLFTGIVTHERHASTEQDESNILAVGKLLGRNDQFWVVVTVMMLSQSAYVMVASGALSYFEAALGDRMLSRWPLTALTAAGLVASFLWPPISRRFGKRIAWSGGLALSSATLFVIYAFVPNTALLLTIFFFAFGLWVQSALVIQFAAAADALDYGEWKSGRRVEAIGFATITCTMKLSLAIGNGLTGWGYQFAGLRPAVAIAPGVEANMRIVFLCVPAALYALAALATWRFRISAASHREMLQEIDRRRASLLGTTSKTSL